MSITAIILLAIAIYLLLKVAGAVFKLGLIVVVLASAYWLAAPFLGLRLPI